MHVSASSNQPERLAKVCTTNREEIIKFLLKLVWKNFVSRNRLLESVIHLVRNLVSLSFEFVIYSELIYLRTDIQIDNIVDYQHNCLQLTVYRAKRAT